MSLRRRLFLLLGGLICLLLVGQWLLFRSLTQAVTDDVRTVAFRVGEEILSGFSYRTESRQPAGSESTGTTPGGAPAGEESETHVVIVTTGEAEGALPTGPDGAAELAGDDRPHPIVLRRELHFRGTGARVAGTETEVAATEGVPAGVDGEPPVTHLRKMVLETDAARDVLFVRGPEMQRRIPIPNAAIATTLDRFGSRLLLGNLALLAVGLAAAAVMAHRLTRPLTSLTAAAERVGSGELGAAVEAGQAARRRFRRWSR